MIKFISGSQTYKYVKAFKFPIIIGKQFIGKDNFNAIFIKNYLPVLKNFNSRSEKTEENQNEEKSVEDLFIGEQSIGNEILPIKQKITNLIVENGKYQEYDNMINISKILLTDFDLDKFKILVNYINDNGINDVHLFKQFELVFIKNLNSMDYITKSNCVVMLGNFVNKKKSSFQEENWFLILKDFQSMIHYMNFAEYYSYIITFDRLIKKKLHESQGNAKYSREFENFFTFQNMQLFNSGKIPLKTMEDVYLFSKLTHSRLIKISNVSESIWLEINKIVKVNVHEMAIYECLIITSLFINYQEISGKANIILPDSIKEVNNYLISILTNYELLEHADKEVVINYADNIFNYFAMFGYHRNKAENSPISSVISSLINIYTEKLKSDNPDFMIFKEFRILQLLSKDIGYKNEEFWTLAADKTLEYIDKDFMKILNDIFPKKMLRNSSMTDDDKIKFQEKCEIQILIYAGMIIETFSSADYYDKEFWFCILDKVDKYASFRTKDVMMMLNFISIGCKRLYKQDVFLEVWEKFTDLQEHNLKIILKNREIAEFVIKAYSNNFKSDYTNYSNTIDIQELNKCLNTFFMENSSGTDKSQVKLYSQFFSIIENKIKNDNKVLKILSNVLVDLIKLNEDYKQNDFDLKFFQAKLEPNTAEKISSHVKERIKILLFESEMNDECEKKSFYYLIRKMMNADFIDNLDIHKIKYTLEKEDKLTENRKVFFDRIMKE